MTSARSSCSRTRTTATRSTSPVTEYTSLTPSSSAIAWAASGMRATSVSTRTMAVITAGLLLARGSSRSLVATCAVNGPGGRRGGRLGSEPGPGTGGAVQRRRPLPVEVDQAHAGLLEPREDLLGLLGVGGGHGCRRRGDVLRRGPQRGQQGPVVGPPRGHGGSGEPPVPHNG